MPAGSWVAADGCFGDAGKLQIIKEWENEERPYQLSAVMDGEEVLAWWIEVLVDQGIYSHYARCMLPAWGRNLGPEVLCRAVLERMRPIGDLSGEDDALLQLIATLDTPGSTLPYLDDNIAFGRRWHALAFLRLLPALSDEAFWSGQTPDLRWEITRHQLSIGEVKDRRDIARASDCLELCPEDRQDLLQQSLDFLTRAGNCGLIFNAFHRRPQLAVRFPEHPCRAGSSAGQGR